ncbi:MAG: hypothetical protein U1D55_11870 [Phycisphaerae bacterium]
MSEKPLSSPSAIRANAMRMLIEGGVLLYFGMSLIATAPGTAAEEAVKGWIDLDNTLFLAMRILGFAALGIGLISLAGRAIALRLGALLEFAVGVLLLIIAAVWMAKARVDGEWSAISILVAILAVSALWDGWVLLQAARGRSTPPATDAGRAS